MYEFIIAVCLAYDISGDPVNPCYMERSPHIYSTYSECKSAARKKELEFITDLGDKYPKASIVITAPCGEVEGTGS